MTLAHNTKTTLSNSAKESCGRVALNAVTLLLLGLVQPALAQTPLPGSGSAQDRTPQPPQLPQAAPRVDVPRPAAAPPSAAEDRRIQVKALQVEGNSAFDSATLLAAAGARPGEMTLAQLRGIAEAITEFYRARGYAVAQARLPSQDVTDGTVRIVVLEGRLAGLQARSADAAVQQRVQDVLDANLGPSIGQPLKQAELERAIILAGDMSAATTRASLGPGEAVGTTRVNVDADPQRRFNGDVVLNNAGQDSTGKEQLAVSASMRSLLSPGDTLSGSALTTGRRNGVDGYNLQYERFLGLTGWYGGLRAWQTNYSLGGDFEQLDASGVARAAGLYAGYAIDRAATGRTRTDVRFGANRVDLEDRVGLLGVSSPRRADVYWADIGGDIVDQALKQPAVTRWRAGLTVGQLHYDNPAEAQADATGLRRAGTYRLLNLGLRRDQALGAGFDLVGNLRGQAADKNLDSYHKFGLGGPDAVRAFGPEAPSGDNGYIATLELGHTSSLGVFGAPAQLRVAAFYDYGYVRFNNTPLPGTTGNSAVRAGYGVQMAFTRRMDNGRDMSARVAWARPDQSASTDLSSHKPRLQVELRYPF